VTLSRPFLTSSGAGADGLAGEHERGVKGAHDEGLGLECLDEAFDDPDLVLEELLPVTGQPPPVVGPLDLRVRGKPGLVLDLHEIHPGVAEVLDVLVDGRLPDLVALAEMDEEARRDVPRRAG